MIIELIKKYGESLPDPLTVTFLLDVYYWFKVGLVIVVALIVFFSFLKFNYYKRIKRIDTNLEEINKKLNSKKIS